MAVAAVSPRSSNRIFPIRVQMTATWAIFGVVMGVWTWNIANDGPLMFWSLASAGVLSATLPLAMAERENWTPRLRRHIPRTLPARLLAWLFYTGSAGGVIWSAALGAVSLWVGYAIVEWPGFFKSPIGSKHALNIMLGVAMFTWCYCLSGLFVRRMLIPRSPPLAGTTIAMLLLGVLGAAPLVVAYLVIGPEWQFESMPIAFAIANPFVLSRSAHDQIVVRMFLGVWAGLALLVNLPWFSRQWRAFQRYEPKPILPSEARAEEPPVVQV
jgi:hypothetical protein